MEMVVATVAVMAATACIKATATVVTALEPTASNAAKAEPKAVGADITAGVLASGMEDSEQLTLFMDVGTNGEIVLGNRDWLVTCACSAGPAFEGAGVEDQLGVKI